ncbi:hypothetical protein LXL04_024326 [Taraxacum kok-saghyz]
MAAPVAGEPNLPLQNSDNNRINSRHVPIYDSAEDDFTISQLANSKISFPNPPPSPSLTSTLGKRRKSKPVRYGVSTTVSEKKTPTLKPNIEVLSLSVILFQRIAIPFVFEIDIFFRFFQFVVPDPLSNRRSSSKRNSATKSSKSPLQSSPAMIRAEKFQSSLDTKHPTCLKLLVKAHVDVSAGYWMGFPQPFSKLFLPKIDTDMILEDENGEIHHVKYIANKYGLSAGWKKFASDHKLLEGDVIIFQLVEPFKLKVYIIRANDLNEENGALSLITFEAHTEQTLLETGTPSTTKRKSKRRKNSHPQKTPPKKQKLPSGNDSEEVRSEVLEGSRPTNPNPNLPSDFHRFHITVNGQPIDSELPEAVRMTYHSLCISRNHLLHDSLPEDVYPKLVAGMIGETVNIAKKIKGCKVTVSKEELGVWDKSLRSFEVMGMEVGFMRERVGRILRYVVESEGRFDLQRFKEAESERRRVEGEIEEVVKRLEGLKESCGKLDCIVGGLKEKVGKHEVEFHEEVDAPW